MLARLVLAVSTPELRSRLRMLAEGPDTVISDLDSEDWLQHIGRIDCDLVVTDSDSLAIPVNEAVLALKQMATTPELLMVSSDADAEDRAKLLTAGCLAVISDEVPDAPFGDVLTALIKRRRDAAQLQHKPDNAFGNFLSSSPSMLKFLKIARKLSQSTSTAMILGETGVGKERLARAIHDQSLRSAAPFIVINCGAVPEALMETELFGHERGAFTGAFRARRGLFELAHRGTVFLDEIGEMPVHLQVKLLRVIQERSIQRVGSEELVPIDVRILAATNRDLHLEMAEQRFRSDLFYRLSVVTLLVPPLRERKEDVELLANTYFEQFRSQMPTPAKGLSAAAMRALQTYSWPGNIRELINVIERSVLLAEGAEITPEDFPEPVTAAAQPAPPAAVARQFDKSLAGLDDSWLKRPLAESRHAWNMAHEREYLTRLLQETKGQISATAKRAGIDPRSLYAKMKVQGLRKEDFR